MQCADEVGGDTRRHTEGGKGQGKGREIVLGVSFLTTCDELREARSEIKRVPENSRGSARSNYLRKVRGVSTDCGIDIFFFVFPLFLHRTSFRRFIFFIAFASATGNWRSGKGPSEVNYFVNYFFVPGFGVRYQERRE